MTFEYIADRAVLGFLQVALEQADGLGWVGKLGLQTTSDQAMEEYPWLSAVPMLREFSGGRKYVELGQYKIEIPNLEFEATLPVKDRDLRRDKIQALDTRIQDLATRANAHWAKLVSALIAAGEVTPCYDKQFFFDTDHAEGKSGPQSNLLTVDISELPVGVNGTNADNPSTSEIAHMILLGIQQIFSFVDDQGEPMNELAKSFVVHVPISWLGLATAAVSLDYYPGGGPGEQNVLRASGWNIEVVPNVRLPWTNKLAVFRADAAIKPFILQSEKPIELSMKGRDSDHFFDHRELVYGLWASRNAGYARWQGSCLVQAI